MRTKANERTNTMLNNDLHQKVDISLDMESTKLLSPLYFGDNLEHTRDCINSGLSAQMLKNRKFVGRPDRYGCAMGWYRIGDKVSYTLSYDRPYTKHHESYHMSRLLERQSQVISIYHDGTAGFGQTGLCMRSAKRYAFKMTATAFAHMHVTIELLSPCGVVLARTVLVVHPGDFSTYECTFSPTADNDDVSIQISFSGPGTLIIGAVSLMPEDHFHGMRRDVIEKMKELGIRLLRWPGGNFSGEYNWKDGLLDREERSPFQSYLWIETQPHTFGFDFHEINTDDFIALCREIGAEPFITINPTWNTPEDSADWVEYCNGPVDTPYGALRAQRGSPEPYGVKFWSLGNEFGYGHMEGTNGPAEYAEAVRKHAVKMLHVDNELRLCSSGPYPNKDWADDSAKALKDIAPTVSLHHYATYPEYIDPSQHEQEYYTFISTPDTEYLPRMKELREQLDDDISISYDEWNAWVAWFRPGSISEGIFAARFLNMLYMNAEKYGVIQACHFESVNEGSLLVTPDNVTMTPTGQAISSMRYHAGSIIRALQDDVVATEKDGIITLTLINRSYDKAKTFTIPMIGTVTGATLLSGEGVVPWTHFNESTLPVGEENDRYIITLPEHSIAVIRISR